MTTLKMLADDFLSQKRIAVAGVSRTKQDAANIIYKKLRGLGYQVFAVNPHARIIEGDLCYPDLKSIPGGVDAVVIVTRPEISNQIVRECAEVGISRVWMHRGMGSSVSDSAIEFCKDRGITVIPGACPMMYCRQADIAHICIRWVLQTLGRLPQPEHRVPV